MICWIDAAAGASGDMFLGALTDAGVPPDVMRAGVDALGTEPVRLTATETTRHGLAAIQMSVDHPESTVDRRYTGIVRLIERAQLPRPVKDRSIEVFTRLGRAEAAAHRVPLEEVHFHEVGALDSLADVVAACTGLHWLAVERGVTAIVSSPVTVGGGVTGGAHGGIPLPAPATLAVLAAAGAPVAGEVPYEACTPTGAAIIAAHASAYGLMPMMTVTAIGVGAGGRDPGERANVLRLVLGRPVTPRPVSAAGSGHPHGHEHSEGLTDERRHREVPGHDHNAERSRSEEGPKAHGHSPRPGAVVNSERAHAEEGPSAHGQQPPPGLAVDGERGHAEEGTPTQGRPASPGLAVDGEHVRQAPDTHGRPVRTDPDVHGERAENVAPTPHRSASSDGQPTGDGRAIVLETNIDDLDPRLWPQVLAALLDSGASDAWLTPILMKKGRPAHTLHVLCHRDAMPRVRSAIFAHTSTIGLRIVEVGKYALDREYGSIEVDGQSIGVKLARDAGRVVNVSVEHADVVAAATALGRPVKVVMALATGRAAGKYGAE